ncbi:MAG: tetratricopeptide repeat protein [Acidobacteriota bacterium]|nr:tetratricopeptide repeat protein [Acidobacteriota bacterium]
MKTRVIKIAVLLAWVIFGVLFYHINHASADKRTPEEYQKWISENYDYRFGADKPFAPSNATTFDGNFIAGDNFISAERCAKCHTDMHPQWRESAHANAFREPFYQKNVKDLIHQRDIAFTRHCESCHNPAALFSGALTNKPQFKDRPFDNEGVSCIACHSIESVNGRGIGGYTMGQPAMLQKPDGTKIVEATDQEIISNVEDHKRAMMRDVLKKPEFCAACHKSQVPHELNDYKFLRAFAVGDELQMSSFSKESPHPFYVRNKETCNSCHMIDEPTQKFDVSAKDGMIRSHRWAAANTAIPAVYGYKDQLSAVEKNLKDDKMGVDIFALHRQKADSKKEKLIAPVNRDNFKIEEGDTITADVVVTNKNIGHSFPPELRDFYEAYVEFSVSDANDKVLYKSGFIKPNGYLDDNSHSYKTWLVKENGDLNDLHFIWKTRVVAQNLQIPSGRSDLARYKFTIPDNVGSQIKLTAKLQYRRFTRVFSDYALGKKTDLPIIEMAKSERVLLVGAENKSQAVDPKAMPDWKRWNNYGIALLDQRQFPQAADAFDEVIDADVKDYKPFAFTNKALALMEMGGWQEAEKLVNKSLEIDQNNFRAMFQRGRIDRVRSRLDKAEADFKAVLEKYPRDRQTLQQLGELAKIKSDAVTPEERKTQLQIAQNYYNQVLAIDPEDVSAHYNLMVICQKLGERDEAKKEAAIFKDLKDDPSVTSLASNFLQTNWNIGSESLPFHTHDLQPFQIGFEKTNYLAVMK